MSEKIDIIIVVKNGAVIEIASLEKSINVRIYKNIQRE